MTLKPTFIVAATAAAGLGMPALAQTEISLWHAMAGANNEVIEKIAKDFNASQSDYKVVPVFKGTYPETLNAGIAAFRAGQPPRHHAGLRRRHRRDDGRRGRDQAGRRGAERGRHGLRQEPVPARHRRLLLDARRHDAVASPTTPPRRSSTSTRTSSRRPGSTSNNPPETWDEVWDAAKQIKESGAAPCGYTSAWLTWIHLENFAAWNNVPYGTNENGLAGPDVELQINAPIFVNHFQAIADLAKDGMFNYGGRTSEAKQIFLAGECGIYTEFLGRPRRHRQVGHELRHRPAALR